MYKWWGERLWIITTSFSITIGICSSPYQQGSMLMFEGQRVVLGDDDISAKLSGLRVAPLMVVWWFSFAAPYTLKGGPWYQPFSLLHVLCYFESDHMFQIMNN